MLAGTMTRSQQADADQRLLAALERRALRDPRDPLRARMRALKDTPSFPEHVRYYEEVLVPSIVAGDVDPVEAWEEFGRRIAAAGGKGREVAVDAEGRASAPGRPGDDGLLLFIPADAAQPALPLRVPVRTSPAQDATLALLVEGRQRL